MSKEKIPLVDTPLTDNADIEEDPQLALAALASMDNQGAREKIESLAKPLIDFQTDCFCKRFCGDNHLSYRCSLVSHMVDPMVSPITTSISSPVANASITAKVKAKRVCEWGSASQHWMLDYLINKQRLLKFTNRHGDSLSDYFFQIINSRTFFQRWKRWRFGVADIPLAIQNMGPGALNVFEGLQQQRKLSFIAEQAGLKLNYVETVAEEIIQYLSHENKFHYLQLNNAPDTLKSTSEINQQKEGEAAAEPVNGEVRDNTPSNDDLNSLWDELSTAEQFVIESIIINKQAEETVLHALKIMDIRIKEGVLPEDMTVEMLHEFKTDSLIKLASYL